MQSPPPFHILRKLGEGGMGAVFLAEDPQLGGKRVAVKWIRRELLDQETQGARFLREAHSTAQIVHPNVIRLHRMGRDDHGNAYIVMEYVEGESLAQRVKREGPLSPTEARRLLLGVARGVEAAHRAGVLHRDLKPANILLGADGRAVVADFGLARVVGAQTLTRTGEVVGTPAYMSPEQAYGEQVDERTDVYALGAILYYALTGEAPYADRSSVMSILSAIERGERPAPLSEKAPGTPSDLVVLVDEAMAPDPGRRLPTALAFSERLRSGRGRSRSSRSLLRLGGGGLLLLLLLGAGWWLLAGPSGSSSTDEEPGQSVDSGETPNGGDEHQAEGAEEAVGESDPSIFFDRPPGKKEVRAAQQLLSDVLRDSSYGFESVLVAIRTLARHPSPEGMKCLLDFLERGDELPGTLRLGGERFPSLDLNEGGSQRGLATTRRSFDNWLLQEAEEALFELGRHPRILEQMEKRARETTDSAFRRVESRYQAQLFGLMSRLGRGLSFWRWAFEKRDWRRNHREFFLTSYAMRPRGGEEDRAWNRILERIRKKKKEYHSGTTGGADRRFARSARTWLQSGDAEELSIAAMRRTASSDVERTLLSILPRVDFEAPLPLLRWWLLVRKGTDAWVLGRFPSLRLRIAGHLLKRFEKSPADRPLLRAILSEFADGLEKELFPRRTRDRLLARIRDTIGSEASAVLPASASLPPPPDWAARFQVEPRASEQGRALETLDGLFFGGTSHLVDLLWALHLLQVFPTEKAVPGLLLLLERVPDEMTIGGEVAQTPYLIGTWLTQEAMETLVRMGRSNPAVLEEVWQKARSRASDNGQREGRLLYVLWRIGGKKALDLCETAISEGGRAGLHSHLLSAYAVAKEHPADLEPLFEPDHWDYEAIVANRAPAITGARQCRAWLYDGGPPPPGKFFAQSPLSQLVLTAVLEEELAPIPTDRLTFLSLGGGKQQAYLVSLPAVRGRAIQALCRRYRTRPDARKEIREFFPALKAHLNDRQPHQVTGILFDYVRWHEELIPAGQ